MLCSAALLLSNSALLSSSNAFTECAQDEGAKGRKEKEMRGAMDRMHEEVRLGVPF